MGATPEQLEAEIAATREDLADTLTELGAKVSAAKESVKPANLIRSRHVQIGLGVTALLIALMTWAKRRTR